MKKITKRIYAILLIILMLINYIPVIVNAVEGSAVLTLESTASKYIGLDKVTEGQEPDRVLVDLKVSELNNVGDIKQFAADVEYDETALQLEEVIVTESGYSNESVLSTGRIVVTKSSGNGTIGVNDIICTLKFKALKSSDTQTTVKVTRVDATCNNSTEVYYEDENVNAPEITLPVESTVQAHSIQIINKDNVTKEQIVKSTLLKITNTTNNTVMYKETGTEGTVTVENLEMPETLNCTYKIEQILAPEGYMLNSNAIEVEVQFNSDGIISNINTTSEAQIVEADNKVIINLYNVAEEVKPVQEVFNLVLNKVDEENNSITTDTTDFDLTIPDGTTNSYTTNMGTGKTENIALIAPETAGTYAYLIKETRAPEGYITEPNNIILELTFEEKNGEIALVSGNIVSYDNEEIVPVVNNEVKTITVNIKNEKETITYNYTINIDKVKNDTFKTNITEDNAIFEIEDGNEIKYVKTNALGKASYNFSMTNKDIVVGQEYIYTIKEIKAPNGYVLDETSKTVKLTFNSNGNINTMEIEGQNVEKLVFTSNVANIQIVNEEEPEEEVLVPQDFDFVVKKVDENGNLITTDSANFVLTNPDGTKNNITTINGISQKITLSAPEKEGKQIYFLKETKAPEGYDIVEQSIVIEANFIKSEGKIVLSNAILREYGKTITPSNNTLTVEVTNNKQEEPEVIVPQDFDFVVRKVDENGNLITTDLANFVLTNPDGTKNNITTINGVSSKITLTAPEKEGKQIYFLKETKAPEGYDILEESIVIEANFIQSEGKIILSNAILREYGKTIVPSNNTLTIDIVNTKQEEVQEQEKYYIKINGVDRENNKIESGTTVFKVENKATGEYFYKEIQISDGRIELDMPKVEGTTEYRLEQIKAPDGYEINSNPIDLTMNFEKDDEGKLKLSDYTVNGTDVSKGTNDEENTASVVLVNDEIKIEPEKQNYSIEINKLDSETDELITNGAAVFTVINSSGNSKEYATTNGKLIIEGIIPGNVDQTQTFIIKEKVAPDGYVPTAETIILKVSFAETDGKVIVTNPELIMGNTVASVQMEENNIKINIINEKENEELYVISKKYSDGIDIYNLFNSYTGKQYEIQNPFIDTKEAVRGNNVSVQIFINNLESNGILTVWDKDGNQVPNGDRVKTGMTLRAIKGEQEKTFTIIVKGDCDGDGRVRTVDLNMLEAHLSGEEILTDPIALRALDLKTESGDGIIRTTDLNEYYSVLSR